MAAGKFVAPTAAPAAPVPEAFKDLPEFCRVHGITLRVSRTSACVTDFKWYYVVSLRTGSRCGGGRKCVVVSPVYVGHRAGEGVEDRIVSVGAIAREGIGI